MDTALTTHQGSLAAGSTKRGIAPVYADKKFRHGIRMIDLTEPDILKEKLHRAYQFNYKLISAISDHVIKEDEKSIYKEYCKYGKKLSQYIKDVSVELYCAQQNGKAILFEGAQGISLDIDHGIYPYTTSSNSIAGNIDLTLKQACKPVVFEEDSTDEDIRQQTDEDIHQLLTDEDTLVNTHTSSNVENQNLVVGSEDFDSKNLNNFGRIDTDLLNNLSQQAIEAAIKGNWQYAIDINSKI